MMLFGIFSFLLVSAATLACGGPVESRANEVKITFIGAAGAQFTQRFPLDGDKVKISMFINLNRKHLL